MSKRIAPDNGEMEMLPNPKHVKVGDENLANLLDDIEFMDFDDEFTSSDDAQMDVKPLKQQESTDTDTKHNYLDLTTWKRCVIERCERDARTKDLIIFGQEDLHNLTCNGIAAATPTKPMQCRLQSFWSNCRIDAGDIISIIAIWIDQHQTYCVTNNDGLVVVRPDFLVSGTTIVSGLFCMRKAVLQDRFKGIETGIKIVSKSKFKVEPITLAHRFVSFSDDHWIDCS